MASIQGNPHGASLLTIIVFGLAVVPLSFGLRLWARRMTALTFWLDDLIMGFALVGALGVVVDNLIGLHFGEGYHAEDVSKKDHMRYAQTVFAFFFLQTVTVTLIKFSLLLLYWRTFTVKHFRYAVYAVGAFILANALENIFGFLFQCIPIKKFWQPMLPGHCVNQKIFIVQASTLYMVTDFALYIMPMPVIWSLQMTTRRRVELSIVFLVGGFVCLTGIARIVYSIRIDVKDLTYTNANPALWNIVESQVGFVAANIPSMGPLFSRAGIVAKKFRHSYPSRSNENGTLRRHEKSFDGFERMMDESGVIGVASSAHPGSGSGSEILLDEVPMNEIVVKTALEQHSEDRRSSDTVELGLKTQEGRRI